MPADREIIDAALEKARELGADVAGAVPAGRLVDCPSAVAEGACGSPADRGTYIVLGLSHGPEHPELDLWEEGRGTPGDRILAGIGRNLARWLSECYGISARVVPYQVEDGGIYLKDAACIAGIGRMGRNNLVIVRVTAGVRSGRYGGPDHPREPPARLRRPRLLHPGSSALRPTV